MSVYVDNMVVQGWVLYGKPISSCHLFADTEKELHQFAKSIGLKKEWAQGKKNHGFSHYDLVDSKRRLAVRNGATEVDKAKAVEIWKRLRASQQARDPGEGGRRCWKRS